MFTLNKEKAKEKNGQKGRGRGCIPYSSTQRFKKAIGNKDLSGDNEQQWLLSSEGIKHAKVLMCEGKITIDELKEIVKGDKKYYSLTSPAGHQDNVDEVCPISLQPFKAGAYDTVVLVDPVTQCQIMYDTKSIENI